MRWIFQGKMIKTINQNFHKNQKMMMKISKFNCIFKKEITTNLQIHDLKLIKKMEMELVQLDKIPYNLSFDKIPFNLQTRKISLSLSIEALSNDNNLVKDLMRKKKQCLSFQNLQVDHSLFSLKRIFAILESACKKS